MVVLPLAECRCRGILLPRSGPSSEYGSDGLLVVLVASPGAQCSTIQSVSLSGVCRVLDVAPQLRSPPVTQTVAKAAPGEITEAPVGGTSSRLGALIGQQVRLHHPDRRPFQPHQDHPPLPPPPPPHRTPDDPLPRPPTLDRHPAPGTGHRPRRHQGTSRPRPHRRHRRCLRPRPAPPPAPSHRHPRQRPPAHRQRPRRPTSRSRRPLTLPSRTCASVTDALSAVCAPPPIHQRFELSPDFP